MERYKQKAYNNRMESIARRNMKKKQLRELVKELGEREINLNDLVLGEKMRGLQEAIQISRASLWDAALLRQFAIAITEEGTSATRAAEFLRDTAGEKPATQLDVTSRTSPLEGMSIEELRELSALLGEQVDDE